MLSRSRVVIRVSLMSEQYLSTREAAESLNVSLRTVQLWVEAGVLPAWKTPGGHRRIPRSALDGLLARPARQVSAIPRGARRTRVLVIEPEPDVRRLFGLHLRSWRLPLDVQTVASGFEGLMRIGRERPDLLITDVQLPGMDGLSMIRSLMAHPATRPLSIIVVTALARAAIRERGGLPPDVPTLSRPLRFEDLRELILARIGGHPVLATGS